MIFLDSSHSIASMFADIRESRYAFNLKRTWNRKKGPSCHQ